MALRPIRQDGDPVLRKKAKKVERIDPLLFNLLEDMAQTMYHNDGIGLAGNQVGVLKRVVVIDAGDGLLKMVNPRIVFEEGSCEKDEGCLSFPGLFGMVQRSETVRVKYLNEYGQSCEIEGEGMLARALQHEIDHLDGKVFTDKARDLYRADDREDAEEEDEAAEEDSCGSDCAACGGCGGE